MIINYLKLYNIRSYKNELIKFPKSKVLLVGDVGAGKSTILLSIEFALFGIIKGDLSGESLLRKGEKEGYVELGFSIDNKEYIIKRKLKKNKKDIKQKEGYIIINSVKYDLAPSELKLKVFEILGYSKQLVSKSKAILYRYTVYTPQEKMKEIIFQKDEDRLDTIRRIFRLDRYKRIIDNISIITKNIREKRIKLEGYTSDIDIIEEKLKENKTKIENEKEILNRLKNKFEETKNKLNKIKEKKEKYDKLIDNKNEINLKIELSTNKIKNYIEQVSEINKIIKKTQEELNNFSDQLNNLKKNTIGKTKDEIELEIKNKEDYINNNRLKINNLKNEQKYLNKELEQINRLKDKNSKFNEEKTENIKKLDEFDIKIKQYKEKIEPYEELKQKYEMYKKTKYILTDEINKNIKIIKQIYSMNQCPLCLQEVTQNHKIKIKKEKEDENNKKQIELNRINQKVEELSNKINEIEKLKIKYQDLMNSKEWVKQQINQLNKEIEINEKTLKDEDRIKKEIKKNEILIKDLSKIDFNKLNNDLLKLKNELKKYSEIDKLNSLINEKEKNIINLKANINSIKLKIGEINIKRKEIMAKLKEINQQIDQFGEIDENYKKIQEEFNEINIKYKTKENQFELLNQEYKKILEEVNNKRKSVKEMKRLKLIENWLSHSFLEVISSIEKHILSRIYYEFNEYFIKWLSLLMDNENITGYLNEEFKPIIEQNGYNVELENLSGGEKTSVALAYRLSLNRAINNLVDNIKTKDIIILDEPTDGFSTQQLDRVRDVLNELNIKQMIIVSHETKMESFVDSIIRIVKENNLSKVFSF